MLNPFLQTLLALLVRPARIQPSSDIRGCPVAADVVSEAKWAIEFEFSKFSGDVVRLLIENSSRALGVPGRVRRGQEILHRSHPSGFGHQQRPAAGFLT